MWWSALRYGVFTTERKMTVDPKPLVHTSDGNILHLVEESQEPFQAKTLKRRREQKEAHAAGQKKMPPRFASLDFKVLAIAEGWKKKSEALAYSQTKGSAGLRAYMSNNQKRITELLREAAEWDQAQKQAAEDREQEWALVERLSNEPCSCPGLGCDWRQAADAFFQRNAGAIDKEFFWACLRKTIVQGPTKQSKAVLLVWRCFQLGRQAMAHLTS
jgi:hypothetical protein